MLTVGAGRSCPDSRAWGCSSASPARCTIASIVPVASRPPNSSPISSPVSRRETRLRTARVAPAACRRGPPALRGTSGRQLGTRLPAALGAARPVQTVLAHPHRDRWQLADLVALRGGRVDALVLAEGARAVAAALRPVVDHLVHPLERKQPAVLTLVSGLTAAAAARAWLAWPRRCRGRVLRGWQRGVARASVEALLELGDPCLKPPVRLDQLADPHQQRERRLPIPVENRLCLGTLHDAQVRRAEAGPCRGPERLPHP